jgi:UDPglucose 6-dehydrogenase/GDP-mannose 6-dehydrogenase
MIKYASNAMLATQISFSNELANLCSILGGVDIVDVMKGVHLSNYLQPVCEEGKRVKAPLSAFLEAGCGFGGSCLPKDVKALIAKGASLGEKMNLLSAVIKVNEGQPTKMIKLIKKHYPKLEKVRVAVLGLSFKPDTDDMRESPAIPIIRELISEGAFVKAYDPVASEAARRLFGNLPLSVCKTLDEAISRVDVVALVTRWEEFRVIPELLKCQNPGAIFIDGRRMLDKRLFGTYEGIGV